MPGGFGGSGWLEPGPTATVPPVASAAGLTTPACSDVREPHPASTAMSSATRTPSLKEEDDNLDESMRTGAQRTVSRSGYLGHSTHFGDPASCESATTNNDRVRAEPAAR